MRIAVLLLLLFITLAAASDYEVWVIDQSDTTADGGGLLYIYEGDDLERKHAEDSIPEVIDLGLDARTLCIAQTGTAPRRPHMLFHNQANTHVIISFVVSGHVLFVDADTRAPLACIDVGAQAHAALPSHDETFVVVTNQAGKLLQRINTDYSTNTFALDNSATIDLATCTTPNGFPCQSATLRPNNQPVCGAISNRDDRVWVTLAGGGLFVVDPRPTPMQIVGEYDVNTVRANGCGGVEANRRMYINSGGPLSATVYSFPLSGYAATNPPNNPSPGMVYSHDGTNSDSHGMVATKRDRYLWTAERFGNIIAIVNLNTEEEIASLNLVGPVSADPTPDLMGISPSGNRVFLALRGPIPLTQNNPAFNNTVGATPGVGVVKVTKGGRRGIFYAIAPIHHYDANGVDHADPHGILVRSVE